MKFIRNTDDEETSYWLSYSDMMAALLLIFVLIISFTMMQAKKRYEEKESELAEQQSKLIEQQLEAENQKEQMKEQQDLLERQQQLLEEQQVQLDQIIGVRTDLVSALKVEFEDSDLSVKVDPQTGAITFDSSVLFDYNESTLKPSGRVFLEQFLPRYFNVLRDPKFKEYVAEVIVEGHTDTNGGYIYNLSLSQDRALSVASFFLKDESDTLAGLDLDDMRSMVTANGRSYSDPILNPDGSVNMEASRRVEFKFRLKDEEMIRQMNEIMLDGGN